MDRRILICDELHPEALERFRARGFEPEVRTGMDEATLIATVPGIHALVVRSATKITRPVLEAADELQVVGRAGVGVDNVDVPAATASGVVVMNTPTGNTTTTGELAISLLCSLARHIPAADRTTRGGSWKKKGLMGTEITGKTLGIIGLGRIGHQGSGLGTEILDDHFLNMAILLVETGNNSQVGEALGPAFSDPDQQARCCGNAEVTRTGQGCQSAPRVFIRGTKMGTTPRQECRRARLQHQTNGPHHRPKPP